MERVDLELGPNEPRILVAAFSLLQRRNQAHEIQDGPSGLNRLRRNAQALHGAHQVEFVGLFEGALMRDNTRFRSFQAMVDESGIEDSGEANESTRTFRHSDRASQSHRPNACPVWRLGRLSLCLIVASRPSPSGRRAERRSRSSNISIAVSMHTSQRWAFDAPMQRPRPPAAAAHVAEVRSAGVSKAGGRGR